MKNKTHKIVITALMAAMTCVATMVIRFPSPTSGYIHLGDGFVLLSGIVLGPVYGGIAAGIGSMFSDLFSGYAGYAGATFLIKALAAIGGGIVFHALSSITSRFWLKSVSVVAAGICGGIIVTGGYYLFEAYIMGLGTAAALTGVPFNLIQNAFGIIISFILFPIFFHIRIIRDFITNAV